MGTRYRCVCPDCTAYITSTEEPLPSDNVHAWEWWWEAWNEECRDFLAGPCPHHGEGIENLWEYRQYEDPTRDVEETDGGHMVTRGRPERTWPRDESWLENKPTDNDMPSLSEIREGKVSLANDGRICLRCNVCGGWVMLWRFGTGPWYRGSEKGTLLDRFFLEHRNCHMRPHTEYSMIYPIPDFEFVVF